MSSQLLGLFSCGLPLYATVDSLANASPASSIRTLSSAQTAAVVDTKTRYILMPLHDSDIEHWSLAFLDLQGQAVHLLDS